LILIGLEVRNIFNSHSLSLTIPAIFLLLIIRSVSFSIKSTIKKYVDSII